MPELKVTIPYYHDIKDKNSYRTVTAFNVLSKNNSHRIALGKTKGGKRKYFNIPNKAYTKTLEDIGTLILGKLNGHKFAKDKIMLDIMVYKTNMNGDPLNLVDGIADAVKGVIGVDDRYYGMFLDWEIDKENPRIELTIKQEDIDG